MTMASNGLEREDHQRDADFNKALHGKTSQASGGIAAMFSKDKDAKKLAVDEYFKHFDNKKAENETAADREVHISCHCDIALPHDGADTCN
jgi:sterol 24-C-methyltransferase